MSLEERDICTITIGKYSDKYICELKSQNGYSMKRVRKPRSKIDSNRLPEMVHIKLFGRSIIQNIIENTHNSLKTK